MNALLRAGAISVMPPELANQIAAGEVVERPASVVKELMENSVDAGAEEILIGIEGGGRRLITVRDDGVGMDRDEARLSLERHATSKVRTAEDLSCIRTLGFRGEALPSIASVSRMTLTTRPHDALEGTAIEVEGGQVVAVRPGACPAGTEVVVRDLFFNTPARLKFLKSEHTERRHILEATIRLGLARPAIRVRLMADGRTLVEAPATEDLRERAAVLLGESVAQSLYEIAPGYQRDGVRLRGLFGSPKAVRRNAGGIYTFVNGRFVRDRRIQAAIGVAYGTLVDKGKYPNAVLYLEVPLEALDVNVHPMKTEVRFHEPDLVFRVVRGALVEGLAAAPWVPSRARSVRVYRLEEEAGKDGVVDESMPPPVPVQQTLSGTGRLSTDMGGWWSSAGRLDMGPGEITRANYFSSLVYGGRLGDTYLVCQDEDGMVVIDQHAAHERITFERLRQVYGGHHHEVQSLLLPLQLELDSLQAETLREHGDFFSAMGFDLEAFSGDTFVLRTVPAVLRGVAYERLVRDALDEIGQHGHSERVDEAVDAVLSRMACHGSVRAGDRMKPTEVQSLLAQMDEIDFGANCPHGRPVFFRMSWAEIERRFERR